MNAHGFVMFGWSWNEASVLGSQVFGQASMEGFVVSGLTKGKFDFPGLY